MDHWLSAVEQDKRKLALAKKIIRDKPAGLADECWNGNGQKVSNSLCPAGVVQVEGTPRTVAGDAITTDANKCQLEAAEPDRLPRHHVHRRGVEPACKDFPDGRV